MSADHTGTRAPQTHANPALLHRLLGIGLMIVAIALVIAKHSIGDPFIQKAPVSERPATL